MGFYKCILGEARFSAVLLFCATLLVPSCFVSGGRTYNATRLLKRFDNLSHLTPQICISGHSHRVGDILLHPPPATGAAADLTRKRREIQIIHKSCQADPHIRSPQDDICHINPQLHDQYVVCIETPNRRNDVIYDQEGCYYDATQNRQISPDCYLCCPTNPEFYPKFYPNTLPNTLPIPQHNPKYYIYDQGLSSIAIFGSLDYINKVLWATTNTVYMFDSYVDPVFGVSKNITAAIAFKHELYFLLRSIYGLKNIHGAGQSISITNKKAVVQWLNVLRGALVLSDIKLEFLNEKYHSTSLLGVHRSVKAALLPVKGMVCAVELMALVDGVRVKKVDVLQTYRVVTSCLLFAKDWYNFVNERTVIHVPMPTFNTYKFDEGTVVMEFEPRMEFAPRKLL